MKNNTIIFTLIILMIVGCESSTEGGSSSFNDSNTSPIIQTSDSSVMKNSQYPEISHDNKVYVDENRREAFKINAIDRTQLKYYIAGKDFDFFNANILTGEVVFREPCDYEKKPVYTVEIVVVDSVGHTTTREITVYVNDIKDEPPKIEETHFSTPLPSDDESKYFVTRWKTDNMGKSGDKEITIPTQGDGYNYSVDWGDGTSTKNITYDATHIYNKIGTYEVKISGRFPYLSFGKDYEEDNNLSTDSHKLLSVEAWGDTEWSSMVGSFANCSNLVINATDELDLSHVTNISWMFERATSFNQNIGDWDVSTIEKMEGTFSGATHFNQDIGRWDVSNVTNMLWMFEGAKSFNQDIGAWDVSNVTNMSGMFENVYGFNQNIGDWDVSGVIDMSGMFNDVKLFNQNIGRWDVSNVTNMSWMFEGAKSFNQDIGVWDVSNVTNMSGMFDKASSFNKNISHWDISGVTNTDGMFYKAFSFNQNIASWDVSNITNMLGMFNEAVAFNQDISGWDISNVTNTAWMFEDATSFNQDLEKWDVENVKTMENMFNESGMKKLPSWYQE